MLTFIDNIIYYNYILYILLYNISTIYFIGIFAYYAKIPTCSSEIVKMTQKQVHN